MDKTIMSIEASDVYIGIVGSDGLTISVGLKSDDVVLEILWIISTRSKPCLNREVVKIIEFDRESSLSTLNDRLLILAYDRDKILLVRSASHLDGLYLSVDESPFICVNISVLRIEPVSHIGYARRVEDNCIILFVQNDDTIRELDVAKTLHQSLWNKSKALDGCKKTDLNHAILRSLDIVEGNLAALLVINSRYGSLREHIDVRDLRSCLLGGRIIGVLNPLAVVGVTLVGARLIPDLKGILAVNAVLTRSARCAVVAVLTRITLVTLVTLVTL